VTAKKRKYFKIIIGVIIGVLLMLNLTPVMAQSNQINPEKTTEKVVLDGREIFELTGTEQFSAKERVEWVKFQLEAVVESQQQPNIRIDKRNELPIILINDRYLLTVTQRDTVFGNTPEEEANIWSEKILKAVKQAQRERSGKFLLRSFLITIVAVVWAIAFHWFLGRLFQSFRRRIPQFLNSIGGVSSEENPIALKLFFDLSLLLTRITLWVLVFLYATNLFPLTREWSYLVSDSLIQTLTSPILTIGNNSYSVVNFLILISLLLTLIIFAGTFSNFIRIHFLEITRINRGSQEIIVIICKYTIIFLGTLVILQVWGFDLSSLTILLSVLGVGISFGFQDIAKNFGSGVVLLFERPIRVGDFVQVGEFTGTVENIGARSTLVRTLDQISIIVPNSRFLETEVINWSHHNPVCRLHLLVGVAYGSDVNLVRQALLEAAKDCPDVLLIPKPQVQFMGFGDSALNFELLIWIAEPSKQPIIKSEMYFRIEATLRHHKIEIPFPQRDLHLRSGSMVSPELEQALLQLLSQQNINGSGKNNN